MISYRLDHLVLTVQDVDQTCQFYQQVLGVAIITFGGDRRALQLGAQKINLHAATAPFSPQARVPTPGAADFCLLTATPLTEMMTRLQQLQVPIIAGPIQRSGAQGPLLSIYIQDPDGNLIEIANAL